MLATLKQTAELVEFFRVNGTKQNLKKAISSSGLATPTGVFYIYHGLVKAYDITKYNEENLLIIRKQDEVFPLIWAITGREHHIIYQALAPTITYRVGREDFPGFRQRQPRRADTLAGYDHGNVPAAWRTHSQSGISHCA